MVLCFWQVNFKLTLQNTVYSVHKHTSNCNLKVILTTFQENKF